MALETEIRKFALLNAAEFGGKASEKAVIGKTLGTIPDSRKNVPEAMSLIKKIVEEINSLTIEQQKTEMRKMHVVVEEKKHAPEKYKLPDLPNAVKGKVVLRLAPFPSGPLHIGNAKPFVINDEYAKRYKGKLLLVIDDTIGSEEKMISPDAYKLIPDGLKWLGIKFKTPIIYKSNRLKIYYKYAEELLKKDYAYACNCSSEELRQKRVDMIACSHRAQNYEDNIGKWKKMLNGELKEGEAVVRLKTDMKHPNPAFRDRVLLRISERKHPKVGNKFRVWPLLEFSWAIDDYLLGITHVIRGKDLMIESEMEKYIWNIFGWKGPELLHSGLVQIEGVKLSKSKAQKEVASGEYSGWDDPRTWSLQSLAKRGISPKAVREFAIETGFTQHEITVPIDTLYSFNKKVVDPTANRFFFVSEDNVELDISQTKAANTTASIPPIIKSQKSRKLKIKGKIFINKTDFDNFNGKETRLKHLVDCILDKKIVEKQIDPKTAQVIQWVPKEENVPLELVYEDGRVVEGFAEKNVLKSAGKMVQFERVGFVHLIKEKGKLMAYFAHK